MISFPSIEQFRTVVKFVNLNFNILPTIRYRGTVKVHGTNVGIGYDVGEDRLWVQSRSRVITPEADNEGCAKFVEDNKDAVIELLRDRFPDAQTVVLYGEWSNANDMRKYAKRVIILFKVLVNGSYWLSEDEIKKLSVGEVITNCYAFPTYEVDIDFSNPHEAQAKIVELVSQIENSCPVWAALAPTGSEDKVFGEGLVFSPVDTDTYNSSSFWFKAKGEKHLSTRVKTIANPDVEKMGSVAEFAQSVMTESRLKQGLEGLELVPQSLPLYLKWIGNDVLKEESDTLAASGLEWKDVCKKIAEIARRFFISML
jgi:hypothetical protein